MADEFWFMLFSFFFIYRNIFESTEEDFNTDWEEFDTVWEEYEMDFNDEMYFEEEFTEFEEVDMQEASEFEIQVFMLGKILQKHPKFTDKLHSDNKDDWWSVNYTMTKDEMNKINDETTELDVKVLPQHKFNGCGLVISSEVIKAGVNIPSSVFFVHEDSAFMWMTNKVLGNIPQYIIAFLFCFLMNDNIISIFFTLCSEKLNITSS